ncbi:MAG: T9SS type A sorting domain-containing protein, partial [Gammaproteobacteria bacterium]
TDATGATTPDGYLIRWSSVDFASITDPTDGTFVTNSSGNLNVAAGAQTVTIAGLTQNTTYYFKIYPYTNSGTNVNYKTDGTIPQTSCATTVGLWEEFEVGSKAGYAIGNVTLASGSWSFSEALIGNSASDTKNGNQAARLRTDGVIAMNFDIPTGVGYVTVNHASYGTDAASTWHLEASTDGGTSWTAFVGPDVTSSTTLTAETFLVKTNSPVRLRIIKTDAAGGRLNIDDISYTAYSPTLPVRFTTLKAVQKGSGIELTWTNAAEENVIHYTVEGSADGRSFNQVGTVTARLNNNNRADYSFVDVTPNSGDNFYRIKAVENTGKVVYSAVVRINLAKKGAGLNVYPNPVRGNEFTVQLSNLPAGKYMLMLHASNGQQVSTSTRIINHAGGSATENLSALDLKPGVYQLQINGVVRLQKQIIVTR